MVLNNRYLQFLAVFFGIALVSPASAQAQSIDYTGLQSIYGEPVTTSANGSPQRQSEVPLNMEILTAEDIEKSGARTIPEVLRFVPGLSVKRSSYSQYEVSIRGYNQYDAERILVLVNGRQVYTDFFGQVAWDNIPVEISEIKQVEVVKGPNTALFGFNAVSGVINIITVNPLYDDLKVVEARVGNHDFAEGTGVLTHKVTDNFAFKISGGGYHVRDPFSVTPDVRDDVTRSSMALDVWAQVTERVQMQFEVTNNENDRNDYLITEAVDSHVQYDTNSVRGRILADTDFGLWEADIYHNETRANFNVDTGARTAMVEADNRITVAKLNNTFALGTDHILRLGGEYREASNIFNPVDGEDLTYNIWSGSGLWDWRVNERLRTSAALRFDSFELDPDDNNNVAPLFPPTTTPFAREDFSQRRDEFSYNLGAVYDLTDIDTLRANISRGADLPSFTEFGLQFLALPTAANPDGVVFLGDPNVDTAIVHNFELGYDREIDEIDGLFRTALFYQYNDSLQGFPAAISTTANFFGLGSDLNRALSGNIGHSEMYGFELGVDGRYRENWDWFLNYTFVNIDDDLDNQLTPTADFSSYNEYEDSNVEHTINAHIGYNAEDWHAGLFLQYTSSADGLVNVENRNVSLNQEEINDQIIVNANLSFDITDNITWSVSGTSITGQTQQFTSDDAETAVWTSIKFKF